MNKDQDIPTIYSVLTELDELSSPADEDLIEEIYETMSLVATKKHSKDQAKEMRDEILERLARYQNSVKKYEKYNTEYKEAELKLEKLIQKYVQANPDIKPKDVKDSFNGISFRETREWDFMDGISTAKGKRILYDWLMENGTFKDDRFYIKVGDSEIEAPMRPIRRIATT